MIAITPFLFLICLPFATDNCDWDLELTPSGEQVNEYHWVQPSPYAIEIGVDYNAKTIQMEHYSGNITSYSISRMAGLQSFVSNMMEEDMELCTYCGKMSFHGFRYYVVDWDQVPRWSEMSEEQRRYVLGMPEKPQRPSIDYPIWYQEEYAKDRNISYD